MSRNNFSLFSLLLFNRRLVRTDFSVRGFVTVSIKSELRCPTSNNRYEAADDSGNTVDPAQ